MTKPSNIFYYTDSKNKVHLIADMNFVHLKNAIAKLKSFNNPDHQSTIDALEAEYKSRPEHTDNLPKVNVSFHKAEEEYDPEKPDDDTDKAFLKDDDF